MGLQALPLESGAVARLASDQEPPTSALLRIALFNNGSSFSTTGPNATVSFSADQVARSVATALGLTPDEVFVMPYSPGNTITGGSDASSGSVTPRQQAAGGAATDQQASAAACSGFRLGSLCGTAAFGVVAGMIVGGVLAVAALALLGAALIPRDQRLSPSPSAAAGPFDHTTAVQAFAPDGWAEPPPLPPVPPPAPALLPPEPYSPAVLAAYRRSYAAQASRATGMYGSMYGGAPGYVYGGSAIPVRGQAWLWDSKPWVPHYIRPAPYHTQPAAMGEMAMVAPRRRSAWGDHEAEPPGPWGALHQQSWAHLSPSAVSPRRLQRYQYAGVVSDGGGAGRGTLTPAPRAAEDGGLWTPGIRRGASVASVQPPCLLSAPVVQDNSSGGGGESLHPDARAGMPGGDGDLGALDIGRWAGRHRPGGGVVLYPMAVGASEGGTVRQLDARGVTAWAPPGRAARGSGIYRGW
ncbi:hypothetical protein GPECTOR_3g363 [Gonium pectorale]|uniref:Uncharacterized protein n=1 Tax=Gonium pectorale TaxID=33097 RepID=A0A150GZF4_GONPE|nr:hypothetical protein GPECTOR_3g363 [Gonium pectorale]|eukprot:KXZ55221.1 hypothetical protein GPECTOR_3g363 [Gonium pectorale]